MSFWKSIKASVHHGGVFDVAVKPGGFMYQSVHKGGIFDRAISKGGIADQIWQPVHSVLNAGASAATGIGSFLSHPMYIALAIGAFIIVVPMLQRR